MPSPAPACWIGCGTGATTRAVARLLGAKGRCTGFDISHPMVAAARARDERDGNPAHCIAADAQTHAFESVDMIISRFGVMFFDDPVRAFANLRRCARPGAQLRVLTWRSALENPFMTMAERAAAPLLPDMPVRQPNAQGQFAFADPHRVTHILEESGWTGIDIRPVDISCSVPEKALLGHVTRLGPLGLVLHQADEKTRARVIETVRTAFEPYVQDDEVRFAAACWMVAAGASS